MRSRILILALIAGTILAAPGFCRDLVIADKTEMTRIVRSENPEAKRAADMLNKWLIERGFTTNPLMTNKINPGYPGTQLVITTSGELDSTGYFSWRFDFADNMRDGAFYLTCVEKRSGNYVFMVTKDGKGVRNAVNKFFCLAENHGDKLTFESGTVFCDPFIKIRTITMCPSVRRQAPLDSPFADADFETWEPLRLAEYVDMFSRFGFNGMQLAEIIGYGSATGQALEGERLERTRRVLHILANEAQRRRMYLSLFIWGDSPYIEGQTLSWNNENERKELKKVMSELAREYARDMDHIHIHIGDPGGCTRDGCDLYKTPQQITTAYKEEFAKLNPDIEATLSTWANAFFWKYSPEPVDMSNYRPIFEWTVSDNEFGREIPDGAEFLDDTFMPKDICIAENQKYNEDQANAILDSGRCVDVWSWYIGDMETINNIWFNTGLIDTTFSALPEDSKEIIRQHTVELCFHGWPNVINSYCAAQKMWDPQADIDRLRREFCTAAYGPDNADAVLGLYEVCEKYDVWRLGYSTGLGTKEANAQLRKVLEDAKGITFADKWQPNFPLPSPAEKLRDMLVARATLLYHVSVAKKKVDDAREKLDISDQGLYQSAVIKVVDDNGGNLVGEIGASTALPLETGQNVGQVFRVSKDFSHVSVFVATWHTEDSDVRLTLYDKPGGSVLASKDFDDVQDNSWLTLDTKQSAGSYYLVVEKTGGTNAGVYLSHRELPTGELLINGKLMGKENPEIARIKEEAIKGLPALTIDPVYSQSDEIVHPMARTLTFKQMIERL